MICCVMGKQIFDWHTDGCTVNKERFGSVIHFLPYSAQPIYKKYFVLICSNAQNKNTRLVIALFLFVLTTVSVKVWTLFCCMERLLFDGISYIKKLCTQPSFLFFFNYGFNYFTDVSFNPSVMPKPPRLSDGMTSRWILRCSNEQTLMLDFSIETQTTLWALFRKMNSILILQVHPIADRSHSFPSYQNV